MNALAILEVAQRLQQLEQPFALVTVLRVQAPASARPGDKAIVTADGIVHGWIGGGCAQPTVIRTVRQALDDGRARVIRIAPQPVEPAAANAPESVDLNTERLEEILEFGMTCHSGGTLELFIDPMLVRPQMVIIGDTPLSIALCGLAPRVGLPVTVIAHGADPARFPDAQQVITDDGNGGQGGAVADGTRAISEIDADANNDCHTEGHTEGPTKGHTDAGTERQSAVQSAANALQSPAFIVVATQGKRDLQGLRLALALRPKMIFFVASARKAKVLKETLIAGGESATSVAAIIAPAGEPIGAQTPEEIALSVLTEVVRARRASPAPVRRAQVSRTAAAPPQSTLLQGATPSPTRTNGSCCGG